jgi:hypothetical protein
MGGKRGFVNQLDSSWNDAACFETGTRSSNETVIGWSRRRGLGGPNTITLRGETLVDVHS